MTSCTFRRFVLITILGLFFAQFLSAQSYEYPDLRFNVYLGSFTISDPNSTFSAVYGSDTVTDFGAEFEKKFNNRGLYGIFKFRYYQTTGVPVGTLGTTIISGSDTWDGYWFTFGLKRYFNIANTIFPFIGIEGGYFIASTSFTATSQSGGQISTLSASGSVNTWGWGAFGGISIQLTRWLSLFGEVEETSATASDNNQGGSDQSSGVPLGGLAFGAGLQLSF